MEAAASASACPMIVLLRTRMLQSLRLLVSGILIRL